MTGPVWPVFSYLGPASCVTDRAYQLRRPMKTPNLEWREHVNQDATKCKTGCCRTGTKQHCFQQWRCRCHTTIDVSKVTE